MSHWEWTSDPTQGPSQLRERTGGGTVQQDQTSPMEMVAFKARTLVGTCSERQPNAENPIDQRAQQDLLDTEELDLIGTRNVVRDVRHAGVGGRRKVGRANY
jgi:uncharacterized protein with von Willebrand factor type A (vWA) domain